MASLLPILLLTVVLTYRYLVRELPELPKELAYAPDFAVALVSVFVVARLLLTGNWARIPMRYLLVFAAFVYVVISGVVVNQVPTEVAFAGIRNYFKYVPVFLLPVAFMYSDRSITLQYRFLLGLFVLQVPITLWQRFVEVQWFTGDLITGTLSTTASVSILAAIMIVCVAALYMDKRLGAVSALVLAVVVLIPAAVSETKATPVLIAVGGAVLLYVRRHQVSVGQVLQASALGAVLLSGFVLVYDQLYTREDGSGYLELMTSKERMLDNYNFKGIEVESLRIASSNVVVAEESLRDGDADVPVGRIDSVLIPFDALLPREGVRLFFGLGIGNVDSSFGSGGEYRIVKRQFGGSQTTMSLVLWEVGILGTAAFLAFLAFVARDAIRLAAEHGMSGTMGAAGAGMMAVTGVSLMYGNLFHLSEILFVVMYGAGLVVARLVAVADAARDRVDSLPSFSAPLRGSGLGGHK